MKDARPQFSFFVNLYALIFLVGILTAPFIVTLLIAKAHPLPASAWPTAAALSLLVGALLSYANFRCSSTQLTYREGVLFVATSMSTGWVYSSLLCVLPALLLAFVASVGLSLYYDLKLQPSRAAYRFHQLVATFHRHRMRQ